MLIVQVRYRVTLCLVPEIWYGGLNNPLSARRMDMRRKCCQLKIKSDDAYIPDNGRGACDVCSGIYPKGHKDQLAEMIC